jgi:hypothetical protein
MEDTITPDTQVQSYTPAIEAVITTEEAPVPRVRTKYDKLKPARYKNAPMLCPKSSRLKRKFIEIYTDYITNHVTIHELAEKYLFSYQYISQIIKWSVFELHKNEPTATDHKMMTTDTLGLQLQKLEKMLDAADAVRDKVSVQAEIRRTINLMSQIRGILDSGINIDLSDRRQVVMKTADGFTRRVGRPAKADSDSDGSPDYGDNE